MFLKSAGFKKLIKEAYNGPGLRVGNDGEGIYLSGGYWIIWVKNGKIPKKELASIIELTGEIPGEGEGFCTTKSGNQYELPENELYQVMENANQCETYLDITNLSILAPSGTVDRVLQEPGSKRIFLVNERFVDMVDNTVVDYNDGETQAEGPLIGPFAGVFWVNDIMAMHVMCREHEEEKPLLEHLEKIIIAEETRE